MATRATPTKPTAKKPSAFAKITARKPAPPAAKEKAEPPVVKIPQETVSLIEPKVKRERKTAGEEGDQKKSRSLPPISKLKTPEPAPEPTPATMPSVISVPAHDAPSATGEEKSDEKIIHIKPPIIIKDLAAQLGLKSFQITKDLMELNIFANPNQSIETEVAAAICKKHGFVFEKDKRKEGGGVHKTEVHVEAPKAPPAPKKEELSLRAPIVTFMGHVDHGKTSLMDFIRKSRVAAGEAGGITQHIGAYSVDSGGHKITFLDTPGHEAFTAMRARGANVTDIVVLVVAADDGLMPQTLEAISHAQAAKVPIVVAINKIDLPGANVDRVKAQLQEKGLVPEDWGGETICCPVSATKGIGIDKLLEMILLQSEVLELKASPTALPRGTVIEAQVEPGRGPTATVIVRMGTLKLGQPFICGSYSGKVKSLMDSKGVSLKEAPPSTPVKVLGFSGLPNAGDEFLAMESEREAKTLSEERLDAKRSAKLAEPTRPTLETLFDTLAADAHKTLEIILKCDVQGSLEALVHSLKKIESKKIDLKIILAGVGPVTESDILLVTPCEFGIVIGFNVKVENSAAQAAKREGVQIKLYSIIYELIDQVKEAMVGLLDPETREQTIGHAEVKKVFELTKGLVAGCLVTDGRIARTARARVLRGKQPIYDGGISTLRRFQDDVKEVRNGLECGIKLGDYTEYEPGDIIQCYTLEKIAQKL